ncbi:MAG: cupin domain-containing protein [Deltaproteobacteria bacterium]|nr:cupin domain-containing protein [Deltaproteobacteria bacterium]
MKHIRVILVSLLVISLLIVVYSQTAYSQSPQVTKKILLKTSVTGDDTKEAVIVDALFDKGATTGRHTHPGDEYAVVLEGDLELLSEGSGSRLVGAGDAYHNPGSVIHEARNVGDGAARVIVTFIVKKDEAVTQQAQ